jgi:hypothetical protein
MHHFVRDLVSYSCSFPLDFQLKPSKNLLHLMILHFLEKYYQPFFVLGDSHNREKVKRKKVNILLCLPHHDNTEE